jgi:DNA (cytosine-5)-methyltransferase 1
MNRQLTHGSLFAGIGGFEVAAKECGIKTLWNCEIEAYPRLVLKSRFPDVRQYGDIRKLKGAECEPVDVVTFGSPCQSFSLAGARAGLDGASGLFFEAVRIIKEMRTATGGAFPRYAVMENVPGIYSSKTGGKLDFTVVLNELLKLCDETVNVPEPKKFLTAGAVVGDGFSLAWSTICASKFGVAQRRRRMYLVVDFADERAAQILSEPKGEGRDFTPLYLKGQGSAGSLAESLGSVSFEPGILSRLGRDALSEQARTLRSHMGDNQLCVAAPVDMRNAVRSGNDNCGVGVGEIGQPEFKVTAEQVHSVIISNHANDCRYTECKTHTGTVNARAGLGGGNVDLCVEVKPIILAERKPCAPVTTDYVGALVSSDSKGSPVLVTDTYALQGNLIGRSDENGPCGKGFKPEQSYTVNTVDKGGAVALCYQETVSALTTELAHNTGNQGQQGGQLVVENTPVLYQETVGSLCASDWRGIRNQDIGDDKAIVETFGNNGFGKWNEEPATLKANGGDFPGSENVVVENRYAVRRLTPLECLRLQGFPDYWLDDIHIKKPTAEDIEYWRSAWAELGKKKSDNQIIKWLKNCYSDGNAYKAIGNSLAVPCALWVLRGIVENISCNVQNTMA